MDPVEERDILKLLKMLDEERIRKKISGLVDEESEKRFKKLKKKEKTNAN